MVSHAQEVSPQECCGLLVGREGEITAAVRTNNVAADPLRHFLIDPRDHFAAIRDARTHALDVVGAYHSHPRSAAVPSATDRAEAFSGFVVLIIGLGSGQPELGAFELIHGNFVPVPLVRIP